MTTMLLGFAMLLLVILRLVVLVRQDGLGVRPAPRSQRSWDEGINPWAIG